MASAEPPGPRPRALAPRRPPAPPVTGAAAPRCYFSRWGQIGLRGQADAYRSPPAASSPCHRHASTATAPLAALGITVDGGCRRCPGLLTRARCSRQCTRPRCWLAVSPTVLGFAPSHTVPPCQIVPLSHGVCQRVVPLCHPTPCSGCWCPQGGPVHPWGLHQSTGRGGGVSQALSCLNLPLAGAWGGHGGPWVGSGEPGGVVYSHGACFLPPASGEAVSDLLVKPDEPSRSGFLPGSASPRQRVPPRPPAPPCPPPQPQRRVPPAAGLA